MNEYKIIENIWFDKRFAANLGTMEMLYEKFEEIGMERGWAEYPSQKTVSRYIKSNVIALPQDKEFRAEAAAAGRKKRSKAGDEFLGAKADSALSRIRAINE